MNASTRDFKCAQCGCTNVMQAEALPQSVSNDHDELGLTQLIYIDSKTIITPQREKDARDSSFAAVVVLTLFFLFSFIHGDFNAASEATRTVTTTVGTTIAPAVSSMIYARMV